MQQNEPGLLNDAQLSQIQSIVSRSIEQAMSEIATNAARAAVSSTSVVHPAISSHKISNAPISSLADVGQAAQSVPVVDLASSEATPRYGHAALDLPAAYVKQIQSGEFFDL